MNVFRLSPRTRIVALLAILTVAVSHAGAQDRFLRTVALMEALAPVGIVFVQGIDDPIEAGFLGAAVLLHSVPNIVLLLAESSGNAALTRLSRRVGAGAGLSMSAAALGFGTPRRRQYRNRQKMHLSPLCVLTVTLYRRYFLNTKH